MEWRFWNRLGRRREKPNAARRAVSGAGSRVGAGLSYVKRLGRR